MHSIYSNMMLLVIDLLIFLMKNKFLELIN